MGLGGPPPVQPWGQFIGRPQTEWDDDGRDMTLLADFEYEDQHGKHWIAPSEWTIDGASIPPIFWTLIGGPFEGKYRNASVVHDYECDVEQNPWKGVHRMFYNASRCGGVDELKAKVMYWAVYHFGKRWPEPTAERGDISIDGALRAVAVIKRDDGKISLDAIERLTPEQLVKKQVPDEEIERLRGLLLEDQQNRLKGRPADALFGPDR
jgi:hypothetical protein